MIHLIDVNEENWLDIIKLRVNEHQQNFWTAQPESLQEDTFIVTVMRGYLVLLMIHK